jgi:hypothetical protein
MERGGKMRAVVVPDDKGKTLIGNITRYVDPKAHIFTDAHRGYWDLQFTHHHEFVNHMVRYVEGNVHTNHVENFWNLLKRMLGGTYVSVRPWHLMAYVEEEVRRFNDRELTDAERFPRVAKGADGKRLTYKALAGSNPRWRAQAWPRRLVARLSQNGRRSRRTTNKRQGHPLAGAPRY